MDGAEVEKVSAAGEVRFPRVSREQRAQAAEARLAQIAGWARDLRVSGRLNHGYALAIRLTAEGYEISHALRRLVEGVDTESSHG